MLGHGIEDAYHFTCHILFTTAILPVFSDFNNAAAASLPKITKSQSSLSKIDMELPLMRHPQGISFSDLANSRPLYTRQPSGFNKSASAEPVYVYYINGFRFICLGYYQ
jgi:hypothetical protein